MSSEVDNPLHVRRGVARVVFDGEPLHDGFIPRRDDGRTHEIRVTLGGLVDEVSSSGMLLAR
jgi:hypothetical protein